MKRDSFVVGGGRSEVRGVSTGKALPYEEFQGPCGEYRFRV